MRILKERGAAALADDAAPFQDVGAVGEGEGGLHVLLDEEDGDAAAVDLAQRLEDRPHQAGGDPERGFVELPKKRRPSGTIATPFHFRDNVGPNTVGTTPGDRLILGALSITPSGVPTTATATQSATTQPLSFLPWSPYLNQYAASRPFDAALTGQWALTATRDAETAGPVLTPAIADPELLPLVTGVVVTGSGLTPTIAWTLPDLTGFDVEQIRVRVTEDLTNQMLFRSAPLAAGATEYTVPEGVLENGWEYVFSIEVEDLESGALENRSRTFTQTPYVPVQAIDASAVGLQGTADRLAVIGDSRGGNEYYTFALGAGQVVALALTPQVGGDLDLALLDDTGEPPGPRHRGRGQRVIGALGRSG